MTALGGRGAAAQNYPDQFVKLIIPFGAGAEGALEIIASTPEEFAAFIAKDFERQKEIVKTLSLGPKK